MTRSRFRTLLAFTIAVLLLFVAIRALNPPYSPAGSVIDPPVVAPEILLSDAAGAPFALSGLRGRLVLLFFGYTNCPDVCPTTLADMQYVFRQLGDRSAQARFVFVTVDAPRDTPERMAEYLGNFNPQFIGLTGSGDALEAVYRDYNVGVERLPAAGTPGYEVAHISRVFVIDPEGRLIATFPYGLGRDAILADVQQLLAHGGY